MRRAVTALSQLCRRNDVEHDHDPIGELFSAMGRHNRRAADIHLKVRRPGYVPLTTQLYVPDGDYLHDDYVEGAVIPGFIVSFEKDATDDRRVGARFDLSITPESAFGQRPKTAYSRCGRDCRKGDCLVAPGVYDPFSARIVEKLGFEALYLGGNALGLCLGVGQPFVTLTETVTAIQEIRRVSGLPVIVDADAGFGDAAHACLSMRSLKAAGAAAIHIDDQIFPKRAHYHRGQWPFLRTPTSFVGSCAL